MKPTSFAVIALAAGSALAAPLRSDRRQISPDDSEIEGYISRFREHYDAVSLPTGASSQLERRGVLEDWFIDHFLPHVARRDESTSADVLAHIKEAIAHIRGSEKRELHSEVQGRGEVEDFIAKLRDKISALIPRQFANVQQRDETSDIIRMLYELGKSLPKANRRELHPAAERRDFGDFLQTLQDGVEAFGRALVSGIVSRSLEELD